MNAETQQTIYLADYTAPAYLIDRVSLTFRLHPTATRVLSRIEFRPNPQAMDNTFFLHGRNLKLISASIDGQPCSPDISATGLTLDAIDTPDAPFVWEAEVEIDPEGNTSLEGLYMSNGMYCTQCEAEGFRRITYYPDRPDVMAIFDVRIESDAPVLLSNGNPGATGPGWVSWFDPWPKPAYLFALVAGDLQAHPGKFTTRSGKAVGLNIWVRPEDGGKCDFALQSLIKSMKWDEKVYGREYDLDLFNIVAVDDFNAGAMENKGLNIFNSKYVLASPETATDHTYELIESIIAHEYFHNWTGNRITCRDWFQLCLKEGLTVFRDQQFTADMRSPAVKRIDDVVGLRSAQFREDSGPLAHAVRPESFVEINNFYTATVYDKGAEVIGMLKTLVGDAAYAKALDLYFERHDGEAATIENWIAVFQDATGRDLSQFKRWYSQAGTPRIDVSEAFENGTFSLTLTQSTAATPGQTDKQPQVIPVAVGLLDQNGDEVVPTRVLELTRQTQTYTFDGLAQRPIPSILRGFSAPVTINRETSNAEQAFLLAHDTDPFNRWDAGHSLAKSVLGKMVTEGAAPDPLFLDALARVATDNGLDPAFRARVLTLPGDDDMAQTLFDAGSVPDPDKIFTAVQSLKQALANRLAADLPKLIRDMATPGPYSPDAKSTAKRSLKLSAMSLTTRLDFGKNALQLFETADNMTEQFGALALLVRTEHGPQTVDAFYQKWQHDRLVIDMWFAVQIGQANPANALPVARRLSKHADFNWKNPNRFRSVVSAFGAGNPAAFHAGDGAGYRFFADWLIKVDAINPMVAARSANAFSTWRRYDAARQGLMRGQLERIKQSQGLSGDTMEMVSRLLAG